MATTNIRVFDLALQKYETERIPQLVRDRTTVVALEAVKGMVELTPVDTGRAKGNYQVTLLEPASGDVDRTDPTPEGASAASPTVPDVLALMPSWKPGDAIWIHNGVPYVGYLNDGTDRMRARHMLERTVDRIRRWAEASP